MGKTSSNNAVNFANFNYKYIMVLNELNRRFRQMTILQMIEQERVNNINKWLDDQKAVDVDWMR